MKPGVTIHPDASITSTDFPLSGERSGPIWEIRWLSTSISSFGKDDFFWSSKSRTWPPRIRYEDMLNSQVLKGLSSEITWIEVTAHALGFVCSLRPRNASCGAPVGIFLPTEGDMVSECQSEEYKSTQAYLHSVLNGIFLMKI